MLKLKEIMDFYSLYLKKDPNNESILARNSNRLSNIYQLSLINLILLRTLLKTSL